MPLSPTARKKLRGDLMLVGSSEVASTKIPFATFFLIAICLAATAKTYILQVNATRNSQAAFNSYAFNQPLGNTAEMKELEDFQNTFGFKVSDFENGNFWSIITHLFIHIDLIELAANMLALWVFAVAMEEILGAGMFLALFLSGGVVAALAQGFSDLDTTCALVGANGAVAAVMAAYLVIFGSFSTIKLFNFRILGISIKEMPAQVFCALWLFSQVKDMLHGVSAIDVALVANFAGFGFGLVFGQIMSGSVQERIVKSKDGETRIESGKPTQQSNSQKLDEALESQPFSLIAQAFGEMNVPCPACDGMLDMKNPVGERLVKCNGKCSQMTYVDGQVLASCFQGEPATVS